MIVTILPKLCCQSCSKISRIDLIVIDCNDFQKIRFNVDCHQWKLAFRVRIFCRKWHSIHDELIITEIVLHSNQALIRSIQYPNSFCCESVSDFIYLHLPLFIYHPIFEFIFREKKNICLYVWIIKSIHISHSIKHSKKQCKSKYPTATNMTQCKRNSLSLSLSYIQRKLWD